MIPANYYFVKSNYDFELLKDLALNDGLAENPTVVIWDVSWSIFFIKNKIDYIAFDDYIKRINYPPLRRKIINLISTFPHNKLIGKKSLTELLEYDGFSLWWFIRQGFFTHCINALKEVEVIRLLLKDKRIASLIILDQDDDFMAIIN